LKLAAFLGSCTIEAMRLKDRIEEDLKTENKVFWSGSSSETERQFARMVEEAGGVAAKIGCVDVGVFGKDGRLKAVVEVKPIRGRRHLHGQQLAMLIAFAGAGLPAFVWSESEVVRIREDRTVQDATMQDILGLL
jgi:hypothetical protein